MRDLFNKYQEPLVKHLLGRRFELRKVIEIAPDELLLDVEPRRSITVHLCEELPAPEKAQEWAEDLLPHSPAKTHVTAVLAWRGGEVLEAHEGAEEACRQAGVAMVWLEEFVNARSYR